MTKFEEEVKRPDNTGIDPFSKRDVDFSKISEKFIRGAQTLKNWRNYANYKEHQLEQKDEQIQSLAKMVDKLIGQNVDLKGELKEVRDLQCEANNQAAKEYIDRCEAESKLKSLKSQLQHQALPVVPECVSGAIESIPDHYSAFEAINLIKSKVETLPEENKDWLQVYNWLCEGVENQNIFALAFITGKYEVEKPQLFYLKHIDMSKEHNDVDWYLVNDGELDHDFEYKGLSPKQDRYKFNHKEIDNMNTGSYEQIKVEEEK